MKPMSKASKLSIAFKILWEALIIFKSCWRTLLPIMLIHLLFVTFVFLLNLLCIISILTQITGSLASLSFFDPKSPEHAAISSTMRKDIGEVIIIEAIFLVACFIGSSFITMATIHVISMACSEKKQTPRELFTVIIRTWRGPMLTQLLATILNISVSFLSFFPVIVFIMISRGSIGYIAAAALLAILAIILLLYVGLICSLSIVVSVVEEGCYGLAAFVRSVELTKGRRQIGILIMVVTVVTSVIISTAYNLSTLYLSSNVFVRLAIGFGYFALIVAMTAVIHAINTVLYYECKGNGSGMLPLGGGLGYSSLSKEDHASIDPLKV